MLAYFVLSIASGIQGEGGREVCGEKLNHYVSILKQVWFYILHVNNLHLSFIFICKVKIVIPAYLSPTKLLYNIYIIYK